MKTFVLIPGVGTDPRVYAATVEALRELGHAGVAPELPGDDGTTPSDQAAAVVEGSPGVGELVVVGHSLGAFAAPIAAERLRASALILLAPMIPKSGETAGEWGSATGQEEAIAGLVERFGPPDEWSQEAVDHVFLHDVDPEVAAATAHLNGVPSSGMFDEPWPLPTWPDVPTRVLAPTGDRLLPLAFQRRVSEERLGLVPDEMPGGHLPMLARPRELAACLVDLA